MPFTTASSMLRHRISSALRTRGGAKAGPSRWTSPGHEERPKGHFLNRTPPPPGQSRQWEDWELPCYITSFLTIVILGVGLNAKPDLTIETWAHQKAIERLEMEKLALSGSAGSEWNWRSGYACCLSNFFGIFLLLIITCSQIKRGFDWLTD